MSDQNDDVTRRLTAIEHRLVELELNLSTFRDSIENLCDHVAELPDQLANALSNGVSFAREQLAEAVAEVAQLPVEELREVSNAYADRLEGIGIVDPPRAACRMCRGTGRIVTENRQLALDCPICRANS